MQLHNKMAAAYKPKEEYTQNENYFSSTLILDFPASRTARNNFLLFIQSMGFLLRQLEQTKVFPYLHPQHLFG